MVSQENEAWHDRVFARRWFSTNHLFGPGYFIWIIPLCSNMTSIGIVADEAVHPIRHRNSFEKALTWLAKYEPSLFAWMKNEEPLDFLALKTFSYTTSMAFSSERWCCIGEAAAFTDPLYSMGTDLIAMGNRITVHLIRLDESNSLSREIIELYNKVYLQVVDVMTDLFSNMYPTFGTDDVMILKTMWDIACYWGFFSQLVIQDFLQQESLLPKLLELTDRLKIANAQMQGVFGTAASTKRPNSEKTGFYNFGGVSNVTDLRAKVTDEKSIQDIEENIEFLEQFAVALSHFVTSEQYESLTLEYSDEATDEVQLLMEKLISYLTPVEQGAFLPQLA